MTKAREQMLGYLPIVDKDVPNDVYRFAEGNLPSYIFRLSRKANTECLCLACEGKFTASGTKSGDVGICPLCGTAGEYRVLTEASLINDFDRIYYCTEKDGLKIINSLFYRRVITFRNHELDIAHNMYQSAFTVFDNGERNLYKWYSAYGCRPDFHPLGNNTCWDSGFVYPQSVFPEYANCTGNCINLDEEIYNGRIPELKPTLPHYRKVCGVSKNMQGVLAKADVGIETLMFFKRTQIDTTLENAERFDRLCGHRTNVDEAMKLMSINKFLNYFEKQAPLYRKFSLYAVAETMVREYVDYIRMSEELGIDLSNKAVRFPRDLHTAHNQLAVRVQDLARQEREKNLWEKYGEQAEKLFAGINTDFRTDDFVAILPTSHEQLIVEGQTLSHCVGGLHYWERHLEGAMLIFFIRRASNPKKPYFTLQVDTKRNRINQLYGFGDCSAPDDVRAYAEAFVKHLAKSERKVKVA